MNNTIASSALRTQPMTIKYPKDFFGHPQGNTLSDVNITRKIKEKEKYLFKLKTFDITMSTYLS